MDVRVGEGAGRGLKIWDAKLEVPLHVEEAELGDGREDLCRKI